MEATYVVLVSDQTVEPDISVTREGGGVFRLSLGPVVVLLLRAETLVMLHRQIKDALLADLVADMQNGAGPDAEPGDDWTDLVEEARGMGGVGTGGNPDDRGA